MNKLKCGSCGNVEGFTDYCIECDELKAMLEEKQGEWL